MRSCENCKYCDIWYGYSDDYACFHPDADWEVTTLYDENDLKIGEKFDPEWSFNSAINCDFYQAYEAEE